MTRNLTVMIESDLDLDDREVLHQIERLFKGYSSTVKHAELLEVVLEGDPMARQHLTDPAPYTPDVYDAVANNLRMNDGDIPDPDQDATVAEAVAEGFSEEAVRATLAQVLADVAAWHEERAAILAGYVGRGLSPAEAETMLPPRAPRAAFPEYRR